MLIVTIENGHYVSTIDENLLNEVQAMYGYCDKCHGEGCWGTLSCNTCYGIGMWSREVCPVCNEEVIFDDTYYGTIDPNGIRDPLYSVTINPDFEDDSDMPTDGFRVIESIQGMLGAGSTCPNCGESVSAFITITEPCTDCQGEALTVPCDACDGKGWIKK